eukprot:gene12542-biopygen18493
MVGPSFQRLSWPTIYAILSVRLAETRKRCPSELLPGLVPRYGPLRARAPGPQMIWMAPGCSLAFQRPSRDTSFLASGWRKLRFGVWD